MKQAFSRKWRSSRRPAKQRKYRYNAPLHILRKFMAAHLSKDLIKKYSRRSFPLATGDKVKIVRGQFKGRENKVERLNVRKSRVYITGIERTKKDGSKSLQPLRPSNLIITELNLEDKKRKEAIEKSTKEPAKTPAKASVKESPQEALKEEPKPQEEKQNA
jgi:large subunit ribosomal protein L24